MSIHIRKSEPQDASAIAQAITPPFGNDQGKEISELVTALFTDRSALPLLSLVATHDERLIGHILFTATRLKNSPTHVKSSILAPVSVHPEFQTKESAACS